LIARLVDAAAPRLRHSFAARDSAIALLQANAARGGAGFARLEGSGLEDCGLECSGLKYRGLEYRGLEYRRLERRGFGGGD